MTENAVYRSIVREIKKGNLEEPFTVADFKKACPGFADGTYRAFLYKHRLGNPGKETELFELIKPGKFRVIRPFKYDIE